MSKPQTVFNYLGWKTRLCPFLLSLFENIARRCYVEPFGGSGVALYNKPIDQVEIYNDVNGELCNFFTVLRDSVNELERLAEIVPVCARFFYDFREMRLAFGNSNLLESLREKYRLGGYGLDVVSAFATFYCFTCSFGGVGRSFGRNFTKGRFAYQNKRTILKDFAKRFSDVVIESMDGARLIAKCEDEKTLFYCDPPYDVESSKEYKGGWSEEKSRELVETIKNNKSSFVVSCYDSEIYEELLDYGFDRVHVPSYCVLNSVRIKDISRIETVYIKYSEYAKTQIKAENGNVIFHE